ncbi:D-alanyl-D-alanine carboxypeptidase [Ktedonobacter sp. SOSP1-85]|uniref:D-alanyl-D-alanine carboxypeptidase family protein n=1 Tax=Ktedonobacter sp. SOSP1-85 TaxID=2778367 RepID=UPI0019157AAB|nr:serine hydrolase [Ktedonobacter sp. SOSP1-85]GHO72329.1 D-alanyl-D-alanine carboxypeptidase [Ktedonobacter sp. SOSP1-85]
MRFKKLFLSLLLVLMLLFVVGMGTFVYSSFKNTPPVVAVQATPTDEPTPTPSPTPSQTPSPTPTPLMNGVEAYILDASSNRVMFNSNSSRSVPIASTTKIMTAVITLENSDSEKIVTVAQEDLDQVPSGASIAQLHAGDYLRIRHLLYGLLIPSGCDAALTLARVVGGVTDTFVAMMNAKAQALGLTHTHFSNPHGAISEGNYSSASDLVTLARYAMQYQLFATIVSQTEYHIPPTQYNHRYDWSNTNQMLTSYQGMIGIKTGSGSGAGYCIVFEAVRNNRILIGAELGAPSFEVLWDDVAHLLDRSFAR